MRKAAVLMVAALLLTGCTAQEPHPQPLSRFEQVKAYQAMSAATWNQSFGDISGEKPDLSVHSVSTGGQWALDMAGCLREQGAPDFTISDSGGVTIEGSGAGNNGVGARTVELCYAQHPKEKWLEQILSRSQLDVLYDYYVDSLEPCLMVNAGRPAVGTPSRALFEQTFLTNPWTPYDHRVAGARFKADGTAVPTALAIKCPPYPGWLAQLGY